MTLTSTGPSGFHIRPIVAVLAVVAFVAGVYAISQQILTDSQPSAPAATEAVAETAEPYTGPSGLSEAYEAGKLDAGLNPTLSEPFVESTPAPEIVVIEGQGSLYDALSQGKYNLDFAPGDPGVQYVLIPEAVTGASGSSEAFAAGKFDAGLVAEPSKAFAAREPAPEVAVIEGQGSLYDALVEGKYDVEFLSGTSGRQYVLSSGTATDSSGLRSAFAAGQLAEGIGDRSSTESAPTPTVTPTVSGGHQE
ncbi:MAG: hypothetical protein WBP49_05775 [Acidimicrobiia bacterium]